MAVSKKGGISKQLKRKMAANLPLYQPLRYAGLPPALYSQLQTLSSPRDVTSRLMAEVRMELTKLKAKEERVQAAFDAATEVISKFQTNSRSYTDMLLVLDVTSQNLAEIGQQITKLEAQLASGTASIELAFTLQMEEVFNHREAYGRIDSNDDRPPRISRIGLSERSVNVPSPRRPSRGPSRPITVPSTSSTTPPSPTANSTPTPRLVQTSITQFMGTQTQTQATPGVHDTAIIATPEDQVVFHRCGHSRLHRLLLSADRNAKQLLRQSCKKRCGNSTDEKLTLLPPRPQRLRQRLASPASGDLLPDVPVASQINQDLQSKNETTTVSSEESVVPASSSTIRLGSSPPSIQTLSSSPIVEFQHIVTNSDEEIIE